MDYPRVAGSPAHSYTQHSFSVAAWREGEGRKPEQADFPSAFSYLESQEAFIRNK